MHSAQRIYAVLFCMASLLLNVSCGGGSGSSSSNNTEIMNDEQSNDELSLVEPSCDGMRVWSVADSLGENGRFEMLISESNGETINSSFPCVVGWLFDASANCSLLFTVEALYAELPFLSEGEVQSGITAEDVGLQGANLRLVNSGDADDFDGTPANISLNQLDSIPDC